MAKVTFQREGEPDRTVEAKLSDAPFDDHGQPLSILALAIKHGIFLDHACGGVCACSTCHVIVEKGASFLTEATDEEEDMLDLAPGLTTRSRLSCQAELKSDAAEVVVRIPSVNRNLVSEHG